MKTYTYKVGRYEFNVNCTPNSDGIFVCHIPAYDLIFGARNKETIEKKAIAMVTVWMDFYNVK